MIHSRVLKALFVLSVASLPGLSSASMAVKFTPAELGALTTLAKPEQTSLRLNGTTGVLAPGPTFAFLGMERQEFEVTIEGAGSLANLRFNNLQAKGIALSFEAGRLKIQIPFVDQEKAIRSTIGAIHLRGVSLNLWAKVSETFTGGVLLTLDGVELQGSLVGTGLLAPKSVIDQVRTAVVDGVKKKVTELLAKPETPEAVEKGLIGWAQFSANKALTRLVPGTLQVTTGGVAFTAE